MNLRELDFPVRVYWDITPAPNNVTADYLRICDDISESRILNLNLSDTGITLSRSCIGILEKLRDKKIAVSLTISNSALDNAAIALFSDLNVRALFIGVNSLHELQLSIGKIRSSPEASMSLGISYAVGRENYQDLPEVLTFCLDNEIEYLVLPMQRLIKAEECFYVNKNEREELSARLNKINHEGMKLIIHDPFLWRAFYQSAQFPAGGCQAANSMIYISPEGAVYPCPSMPVKLGDLNGSTLKQLLLAGFKKEIRQKLLTPPAGCLSCKELNHCMGGCRGRAYVLKGSLMESDPACM